MRTRSLMFGLILITMLFAFAVTATAHPCQPGEIIGPYGACIPQAAVNTIAGMSSTQPSQAALLWLFGTGTANVSLSAELASLLQTGMVASGALTAEVLLLLGLKIYDDPQRAGEILTNPCSQYIGSQACTDWIASGGN